MLQRLDEELGRWHAADAAATNYGDATRDANAATCSATAP